MELSIKKVVVVMLVRAMTISTMLPGTDALQANPKAINWAWNVWLSAAKTLSDAGIKDRLILEATDRICGYVKKMKFSGLSVELGASWVEGVRSAKPMSPIWPMTKKFKLRKFRSDWSNVSANIYKQHGGLYDKSEAWEAFHLADQLEEFSTNVYLSLASYNQKDVSILTAQRLINYVSSSPLEMAIDFSSYDFESPESTTTTSLMTTIPMPTFENYGDDSFFVADPNGYESVVHEKAKQGIRILD